MLQVDADPVILQELRPDDPAQLEAEEDAGRVQVQHHHREVLVLNLLERQIDAIWPELERRAAETEAEPTGGEDQTT